MKKSKMIMTGIAVLGIVGSALAFTAKPYATTFCFRTHVAPASANCTSSLVGSSGSGTLYYGVQKGTAACTSTICNTGINLTNVE